MLLERYVLPDKYKTGHETVDEQHAYLFAILFSLNKLIKEGSKNERTLEKEILELLALLQGYTRNHFQYEERMMEKVEYPERDKHKNIHHQFVMKMGELQTKALEKKETMKALLQEMADYVREWYLKHVLDEDKMLVTFYKNKS